MENKIIVSKRLISSIYWDALLGERLRELRGTETLRELAARAKISWQLVERLEKNRPSTSSKLQSPPTVAWRTLESLCKALSLSVEDFLQVEKVEPPKKLSEISWQPSSDK